MTLRFSQRIGETPIRNALQIEEMDKDLRVGVWNCFQIAVLDDPRCPSNTVRVLFFKRMWHNFFKRPVDGIDPGYLKGCIDTLREWYFEAEWHQVYDFIEYLAQEPEDSPHLGSPSAFSKLCNGILEREMSGYRIVKGQIMEITDEQEIRAIEAALSEKGPWSVSAEHIRRSADLLFDRKNPIYPNAVKEAISAVESACCAVTGEAKATLGQAIKEVEKKHSLHPAFREAFSKLYGYTSDSGGIRHGSIDLAKVTFEEAKYMLVACSAFVNYLKGISAKGE
jgi:uncharacterized protein with PIN domain